MEKFATAREQITKNSKEGAAAPMLGDEDLDFVA